MSGVLPRVLTVRRSGTVDAEREEFDRAQAAAVIKAINIVETPVKEKHVRTCILGSYKERGCGTFWLNVHKLQLEGNPIVSWKFCHVLHKLLREGHPHVIADSQKYRSKLVELGKLWGHLKDGYGRMILQYSKLLVVKLEFHKKNPRVPGNLVLTDEELESIGEKDVNRWFELSIEMMDYLDEIIELQKAVFGSLEIGRANSMTNVGQCRLAPLILCIMDSNCLYDYLVKMLFKLHSSLSMDVLASHRDRFHAVFKPLVRFYSHSSNLQYFKNLISIPVLPESPPNFLIASAFDDYVSPQVRVFDQASDGGQDSPPDARSIAESTLVDIGPGMPVASSSNHETNHNKFDETFGSSKMTSFAFSPVNDASDEKDLIIDTLKRDLEDTTTSLRKLQAESSGSLEQCQVRIIDLERQLEQSRDLISQISDENERYKDQADSLQNDKNQQTVSRLEEFEKKAQGSEEKFRKMKDVYAKLREDHIVQLKKHASVVKEFEATKIAMADVVLEKEACERELHHLGKVSEERLQQNTEACSLHVTELEFLKAELEKSKMQRQETEATAATENLYLQEKLCESADANEKLLRTITEHQDRFSQLIVVLSSECVKNIRNSVHLLRDPTNLGATCSPEFLLTLSSPCLDKLNNLESAFNVASRLESITPELVSSWLIFSAEICQLLIYVKATANLASSEPAEALMNIGESMGLGSAKLIEALGDHVCWPDVGCHIKTTNDQLLLMERTCQGLLGRMSDVAVDELGDLLEQELKAMDIAIQDAASKIQSILAKSREKDSGIKLEVNEKILDSCNALMRAVLILVQKSRALQQEIVSQGKFADAAEFYQKNHRWTEGLLSAAKAVGLGATVLVDSADKVVSGKAKMEELVVASQEIAASTAQLVVASRVKADRGSARLVELGDASHVVTAATATVVGHVKAGVEILQDKESLDFTKLSLHQAKRLEMESQVRVLELESLLQRERTKFSQLRKRHYQLADPSEGFEQ